MPVEKGSGGEVQFVLRDPERLYSWDEVVALIQKAQDLGLPLNKESFLEQMTVRQLDSLVNDCRNADA